MNVFLDAVYGALDAVSHNPAQFDGNIQWRRSPSTYVSECMYWIALPKIHGRCIKKITIGDTHAIGSRAQFLLHSTTSVSVCMIGSLDLVLQVQSRTRLQGPLHPTMAHLRQLMLLVLQGSQQKIPSMRLLMLLPWVAQPSHLLTLHPTEASRSRSSWSTSR